MKKWRKKKIQSTHESDVRDCEQFVPWDSAERRASKLLPCLGKEHRACSASTSAPAGNLHQRTRRRIIVIFQRSYRRRLVALFLTHVALLGKESCPRGWNGTKSSMRSTGTDRHLRRSRNRLAEQLPGKRRAPTKLKRPASWNLRRSSRNSGQVLLRPTGSGFLVCKSLLPSPTS